MGIENTWAETSAPVSMRPSPPASENLALFTTSARRSNSPTLLLPDTGPPAYATGWDERLPHTPPSPNDLGHFGAHSSITGEMGPFYPTAQDSQDDCKDPCVTRGVCGLRNLGNTCFMSAGIQCLSNTPTLLHFFVLGSQVEKFPPDSLTAQFSALLQRLWSGEGRVVHPADFKHTLGSTYPQFKDYRQHDCQEFLALLLDSLHEQLNGASRSSISKVEVKSETSSSTFADSPPQVERERSDLLLKADSFWSSSPTQMHHSLCDIYKESKTSNVNVLVEDEEPNNKMKYDSDKYPRHEVPIRHRDAHPKHNLVGTYPFDSKAVSTKRIKETNLLQDRSADGNATGDGLDFKRIKLTDQNNCCKVLSCVQGGEVSGSDYLSLDLHKHSNNAVLSLVNGINNRCVNEGPLKRDQAEVEQSSKGESSSTTEVPPPSKEDLQADEHWEKHSALRSVVVDSFLGQFKSTVICSECKHISVTHEPFMYLSVPLPHAMERQIRVTFVPALDPTAVRYLLTVNKQDKVRQLKEALIALRTSESCPSSSDVTLVMAEVLDNHISRILDESASLSQVNDKRRSIYAIEMLPPPSWCSTPNDSRQGTPNEEIEYPYSPQEMFRPSEMFSPFHPVRVDPLCSPTENENIKMYSDLKKCMVNRRFETCVSSEDLNGDINYSKAGPTLPDSLLNTSEPSDEAIRSEGVDIEMSCVPDSSTNDVSLSTGWQCSPVKKSSPCTKSSGFSSEEISTSLEIDIKDSSTETPWDEQTTPPMNGDSDGMCGRVKDSSEFRHEAGDLSQGSSNETCSTQSASEMSQQVLRKCSVDSKDFYPNQPMIRAPEPVPSEGEFGHWKDESSLSRKVSKSKSFGDESERVSLDRIDEWKCTICLEDWSASREMWRHEGCVCILCEQCIQSSCKHNNSKNKFPCPNCKKDVQHEQDFVKINELGDAKPIIRLLTVPVVFRLDTEGDGNNNKKTYNLFGHPNVLRLPSTLPAEELASAVHRLVHTDQPYSVLIVNGVGDKCSRCMYNEHCRGCRVATEGEVSLKSGDTLALRFTEPVEYTTIDHKSLIHQRHAESLSLYDCLKAFSESELLDEHNPWFCPTCQKNQCATKTLSVCRYPDFLIVYLKRFVFHNGVSTKLDNKVTYPLNGLKINSQLSHRREQIVYNLYACVCHIGGVSAGHYTAYAKNPYNSEWYHFNDENVTRQKPQEDDYSNAYILFYQKQGAVPPEINFQDLGKTNIHQIIDDLSTTMDNDTAVKTNLVMDSDDLCGDAVNVSD